MTWKVGSFHRENHFSVVKFGSKTHMSRKIQIFGGGGGGGGVVDYIPTYLFFFLYNPYKLTPLLITKHLI